ncbi:phage portal protein [Parashewanella curva]|uniref:Phage portal protein n=1 Tax=Parashewanella curva TaxID=2338552 RepID=A0A3L8Q0N2_9GAMM|nr:phage portal protein [Parashewanella curva]RLV61000.1 phage portal protein [Parashewanella curva]
MSLLNNAIAFISPSWALKREVARNGYETIKGYEAAKKSRTHKANRESRGANQAVFAAGKSLREQARWLDENHDISIGILDHLEARIVGANGIVIEPQPKDHNGEILSNLANDIQRRFANWSLNPEVTGRYTRPELERLVLRTALRDGEGFGQHVMGRIAKFKHPNPQGTPYSIEALEPDFIPFELNEPSKGIRQGLETNAWRQVTHYHVLLDHPADVVGFRHKTKKIRAENMLHLGVFKRLHQLRGISLFHGIITRLADIKEYEESERVAARISAALAFVIRRGGADDWQAKEGSDDTSINFQPGMTTTLQPGEDIDTVESKRPNTHLTEFRQGQLKAVSAGSRTGYSPIARDYNGSYSSQRQELVEQDESNQIMQQWFTAGWVRPVFRKWLQMEQLNKINPLILPPELDIDTLFDAVYFGPTMPWIDPDKESKSWERQIKGNAASETEWIRARGKNPNEVKKQRKREVDYNRENGLVTQNDPELQNGDSNE